MLDSDTKKRIDDCRDILVGKVPDPKSQVEQITIALIYKFMDDMDSEAEELGGERTFFNGKFEKYAWSNLLTSSAGGFEVIALYANAIQKMNENPGVPALFRSIFKNAYLPYRDPETLRSFLKEINKFKYDHSERLGDAFEYLLSVLGSQGDAGQFRTPRHIIDFMVDIVDPKKDETILDPACGTAGFLISAYKHIVKANTKDRRGDKLSPDDKKRLTANLQGYDISPDMVRLSLVNLYLHGFKDPHISEYDTLTNDGHWNDYFDVILANPPFMSPKGGIKPHKRFSVSATRSEVLFVDYIAEHLSSNGRAAVVVPEGIIFQSGTSYKALRKMLVDDYLVAVISLPAGVFNPYSGVKTSILLMDRRLAKKSDSILFAKIENDGFELGAQRKEVEGNELPDAAQNIKIWISSLHNGGKSNPIKANNFLFVAKNKLKANGDLNLSGERNREIIKVSSAYAWTTLGDVILTSPQYGSGASKVPFDGKVRYVRITDISDRGELKTDDIVSPSVIERDCFLEDGDLLIARSGSIGRTYLHRQELGCFQYAGYLIRFKFDLKKVLPSFIFQLTQTSFWQKWVEQNAKTGTLKNINAKQYASFKFPLPPLEIQRQIVAEIEGYQKIVDGARQVVESYKPQIQIDPKWKTVKLGEVLEGKPKNGYSGTPVSYSTNIKVLTLSATTKGILDASQFKYLDEKIEKDASCRCRKNDIYLQRGNTKDLVGTAALFDLEEKDYTYPDLMIRVRADEKKILTKFLLYVLQSPVAREYIKSNASGAAANMPKINQSVVESIPVPLPDLSKQKAIVEQIEAEQRLVISNKELIRLFEEKIKATINRVWNH